MAIDNNGLEVQVDDNVDVKTINGVHYLLTDTDKAEIAAKEAEWKNAAIERIAETAIERRKIEYGTAEDQLEFAVENGWNALVERNMKIKLNYPKG